eukprot:scaffold92282_cov75-Phaeocystis_antarctica.AAC.1
MASYTSSLSWIGLGRSRMRSSVPLTLSEKASVGEPARAAPMSTPCTLSAVDDQSVVPIASSTPSSPIAIRPSVTPLGMTTCAAEALPPGTAGTVKGVASSSSGSRLATEICSAAETTSVGGAPTSLAPSSASPTSSTPWTSAAATSLPDPPPAVTCIMVLSDSTTPVAASSVTSPPSRTLSRKALVRLATASSVTGGAAGGGHEGGAAGGTLGGEGALLVTLMLKRSSMPPMSLSHTSAIVARLKLMSTEGAHAAPLPSSAAAVSSMVSVLSPSVAARAASTASRSASSVGATSISYSKVTSTHAPPLASCSCLWRFRRGRPSVTRPGACADLLWRL